MTRLRVFLDANVLFSASKPGSAFARLFGAAQREATLLTSELAIEEARRNLALKRPNWLQAFEDLLNQLEIVATSVFALGVELEEKDVPLLCAAVRARSDYLVTGDRRDFGHLFEVNVQGVTIITPLRLGELLAGRPERP